MRRLVLWGHHLDEYKDMFALSEADLEKHFLEYASGATAFNAELHALGGRCVSYDAWFDLDKARLAKKIEAQIATRARDFQSQTQPLDFKRYGDLSHLLAYRKEGIALFLSDYDAGRQEGRYIADLGPHLLPKKLPFERDFFDIALVAHAFFSDVPYQTIDDHVFQIQELARVAKDVRIFPLVDADGIPSPCLGPVLLKLQQANYGVEVREVAYHLQTKGNAMLRVWAQQCDVDL